MRRCRLRGLIPNPLALTGERAEMAQEMQNLVDRLRELDNQIFGPGHDEIPF